MVFLYWSMEYIGLTWPAWKNPCKYLGVHWKITSQSICAIFNKNRQNCCWWKITERCRHKFQSITPCYISTVGCDTCACICIDLWVGIQWSKKPRFSDAPSNNGTFYAPLNEQGHKNTPRARWIRFVWRKRDYILMCHTRCRRRMNHGRFCFFGRSRGNSRCNVHTQQQQQRQHEK